MAQRQQRRARGGIDWEAVRIAWGIALLVGGTGSLLLWATLTAPPGPGRGAASRVTSVSYNLARMLPQTAASRIAAALAALMVIFAAFTFLMGCREFFRRRS